MSVTYQGLNPDRASSSFLYAVRNGISSIEKEAQKKHLNRKDLVLLLQQFTHLHGIVENLTGRCTLGSDTLSPQLNDLQAAVTRVGLQLRSHVDFHDAQEHLLRCEGNIIEIERGYKRDYETAIAQKEELAIMGQFLRDEFEPVKAKSCAKIASIQAQLEEVRQKKLAIPRQALPQECFPPDPQRFAAACEILINYQLLCDEEAELLTSTQDLNLKDTDTKTLQFLLNQAEAIASAMRKLQPQVAKAKQERLDFVEQESDYMNYRFARIEIEFSTDLDYLEDKERDLKTQLDSETAQLAALTDNHHHDLARWENEVQINATEIQSIQESYTKMLEVLEVQRLERIHALVSIPTLNVSGDDSHDSRSIALLRISDSLQLELQHTEARLAILDEEYANQKDRLKEVERNINELVLLLKTIPLYQSVSEDRDEEEVRLSTYMALSTVEPTLRENLEEFEEEYNALIESLKRIEEERALLNPQRLRAALSNIR